MYVLQLQNIKCNIDRVKLIKQIHFRSASQLQQLPEIMAISKEITPHEIYFWDVSKKYKISKKS